MKLIGKYLHPRMVYSFISYEKVCIHINYVTYVVQGLILGWLDHENIMQRIQK